MSSLNTRTARRSRRRLALWLGFGIVGLSMGAIWATGFATFSAGAGTPGTDAIVVPGSPTDAANPLASAVSADATPWTVTWNGLWGATHAYSFFTVTTPASPNTATYNLAMLLSNGANLGATWQTLQLKVWLVNLGSAANCSAAGVFNGADGDDNEMDLDTTTDTEVVNPITAGAWRVFNFDANDSAVYWNSADSDVQTALSGITAGETYCVGIQASDPADYTDGASDTSGTFLRATGPSTTDVVFPQFIATLNRAS